LVLSNQEEDNYASLKMMNEKPYVIIVDESGLIQNYTWAVMRYDHLESSENHGMIQIPNPTIGTILIPTNMMSLEVCRAALYVCRETKMETLRALDEYVSQRMIHTMDAFFRNEDEWHTKSSFNCRKESANEMKALGDICLKADLVGECYSQASFNTAVLRLCGFSPEEVFTVGISGLEQGGHGVNIVKVEDRWYIFDSTYAPYVRKNMRDTLIFEVYIRPPFTDCITIIENDKYLINFGIPFSEYISPTLEHPFSNIDSVLLTEIVNNIMPIFNCSSLGENGWNLDSFIENATPNPWMKTIAVPYTIENAEGTSIEEKAQSLVSLNKDFIFNQIGGEIPNQYDMSLYGLGLLSVDFPQVYANAARLSAWTSRFGIKLDTSTPLFDTFITSLWIRLTIRDKQIVPSDCVAYSDLLYLCHKGSSIEKAVLAYGTLRNMKKNEELWSSDDLNILVTDDNEGYLAVYINDKWRYLSFEKGNMISDNVPSDIIMVFNEVDYANIWEEGEI